jgi:prepilin-type N-terminal cleavage/methylation domain-containing protein
VNADVDSAAKPKRRPSGEAGYSLIELLIVCAVIGIIANIAIPELYAALYRAKATRIIEDYNTVRLAVHQYYADTNYYPPDNGPGIEPPELASYLQGRLLWTHEDYQYDWELWVDSSGNPTQPASGVIVGFSIATTDPALAAAVHKMYKGIVIDTIPNHTTFVIEPYSS